MKMIDLNPNQIRQAAAAGSQLLNMQGAVNVPGPMAVSGIIGTLNLLLSAIAKGDVIVTNPLPMEEDKEDGKKPSLESVKEK